LRWWPLAGIGLGFALIYAARSAGLESLYAKQPHEVVAIVLTGIASLIAVSRLWQRRDPLSMVLAALSLTILFRECHWDWTGGGIYYMLLAIGIWSWIWRDRLLPYLREQPRFKIWLIATFCTYVMSQVIARRAFRPFWPHEGELHVPAEEVTENVAHLMLVIMVALALPRRTGDD
jgi:hypothetical protein